MNINMHYNSVTLFLSFTIIAIITALRVDPFTALSSFCAAALFMIFYEGFIKSLMKLFACFIFILFFTMANPLISRLGTDALFYINNKPYTIQALFYGFVFSVMMSAVLLWFYNISVLIGSDMMIGVFGRVFPKLSLVMSMSLSVLPMYIKNAEEINDCSKTLGLNGKNFLSKIKNAAHTFKTLIMTMPENVIEKSLYMNCRGFGTRHYRCFSRNKITKRDIIALCIYFAVFCINLLMAGSDCKFYPTFEYNFKPVFAISFTVAAFFPPVILLKEKILRSGARRRIKEN